MFEIESFGAITRLKMAYGKVNVLDIEFCRAFVEQLETLESGDCHAIVLTGVERAFSAGIDLKRWLAEGDDYVEPFLVELERVMERIFMFQKPIVAAITGHAIAGGCMMAAACDYRVIGPDVRIGIPEMRVGVPLPMMAIEIMRFVASPNSFQRVVNVGTLFEGAQAVEAGLANEVSESGRIMERAIEVAKDFSRIPERAFQMTKKQSRMPAQQIAASNRQQFYSEYLEIWKSPETRASVQAYVDNRLV